MHRWRSPAGRAVCPIQDALACISAHHRRCRAPLSCVEGREACKRTLCKNFSRCCRRSAKPLGCAADSLRFPFPAVNALLVLLSASRYTPSGADPHPCWLSSSCCCRPTVAIASTWWCTRAGRQTSRCVAFGHYRRRCPPCSNHPAAANFLASWLPWQGRYCPSAQQVLFSPLSPRASSSSGSGAKHGRYCPSAQLPRL